MSALTPPDMAMKPRHSTLHLEGIDVEVVRKDVKHIRISIHPPDGRVRLSAPRRTSDAEILRILQPRLPWITRKRAEIADRDAHLAHGFVTGETHLVGGVRYRLVVIEKAGRSGVSLTDGTIELRVAPGTSAEQRALVLERWYRQQLGCAAEGLARDWAERMGLAMPEVRIKRMKTRWGSCNVRARRIWLNLELARRSEESLEYVVVHELAHLIEPGHGPRFWALLDEYLPGWRRQREALKRSPAG